MRIADPDANTNSHGDGDINSDINADCDTYTDANADSDSDDNGHANSDANTDANANSYTYADLRPCRLAIGSAPASGPLCLPRRPRHGQHALHRRRPDRRLRADRVRPSLAL